MKQMSRRLFSSSNHNEKVFGFFKNDKFDPILLKIVFSSIDFNLVGFFYKIGTLLH